MRFDISTDRLELKVLTSDYAPEVLSFYKRNADIFEQYEPMLGSDFYTLKHQKNILDFEYKSILKLSMIRYWIFEKNNPNVVIGTVSYRSIVRPIYSSCTIGYKMDQAYTNRGYCTEAISNTLPMIVGELGIHRVEAYVLPDNNPSIHLLENLGFEREGLIRDKIEIQNRRLDHYLYSYLADN